MKILFVTPVIPTQTDGRRPFNFLKYLTTRHEVHLICFQLPEQSTADLEPLHGMGVTVRNVLPLRKLRSSLNCLLGAPLLRPLRASWCRYPEMRRAIETALKENFDVVHIDRMRMGQYLPWIDRPNVLDLTDSLPLYLRRSLPFRKTLGERAVDAWEMFTIPAFERWTSRQADAVLLCSQIDADEVQKNLGDSAPVVIENGVDIQQFKPRERSDSPEPKFILTGTLFYFPNIDSVRFYRRDILPAIRRRFPAITTEIIGTRPTEEMLGLDGEMGIRIIPNAPRMEDCLYTNDVYLCPLRVAAGVRNKLLEAMAAGMAIITTRLGAEGISAVEDEHVLFAETPDEFVRQAERVMSDADLKRRLGENSRQYVTENHSYTVLGEKIEKLYQSVIERRASSL
ncbi:MAG: glycosyltransferase [bacterium]|nr:glycosyltransferase [bacterium]